MSEKFEKSLNVILDALDKKAWRLPLYDLYTKFKQIPDSEQSFEIELLDMLHGLNRTTANDPLLPIHLIAAVRLSGLNCWCFRFRKGDHYLDPLHDDVTLFLNDSDISISQSSAAFPAPDIIKRWARENLV